MGEAQNFKNISSKSYKVWRILQAPGIWGQIYRDREAAMANYASAIIFPEQLLGLNQGQLFTTSLASSTIPSRSTTVTGIEKSILLLDGNPVSSYQEIYAWEGDRNSEDARKNMTIRRHDFGSSLPFHDLNLFTNRKDAVKMATRWLEKF